VETDQLSSKAREPLELPCRRAVLQDEVLAFDIAERAHPLQERFQKGVLLSGTTRRKITDPVHVRWRLRVGSERHHKDGEGQRRDEPDGIEPHGALLLSTW
jgi:hypothetical protein